MTKRSITKMGLTNIGRQIRGEALDQDVFLTITDAGVLISPRAPGEVCSDGSSYVARFDQYNRLALPAKLRRDANITKRVDIIKDGDCLILSPVIEVCMVCGTEKNLKEVSHDKFICQACRKEMVKASRREERS